MWYNKKVKGGWWVQELRKASGRCLSMRLSAPWFPIVPVGAVKDHSRIWKDKLLTEISTINRKKMMLSQHTG